MCLRRVCGLLTSLFLLTLVTTLPAQAQTDQRCFTETGFCIAGRIREFWEQNGGLPVFGFPIAPQQEEVVEGKTLQVQWFQRNRLELHPENDRPYDVLLGRLGVDRLAQLSRDWQTFPKSEEEAGCRFFSETRQKVCGAILAAWRSNGLEIDGVAGKNELENLALFGFPLSGVMTETLSDGKEYQVQWFERGRFELHPENNPPFNVLLGLLGNEIRAGNAPTDAPPPQPQPTAPPATQPPPLPAPSFNNCQADPNAAAAPNFPVKIVTVDKDNEVVVLQNVSVEPVDLTGWRMCSIRGNQEHTGISGVLAPGEQKNFPSTTGGPIWSNSEQDDGALYNSNGQLVSYWNDVGR